MFFYENFQWMSPENFESIDEFKLWVFIQVQHVVREWIQKEIWNNRQMPFSGKAIKVCNPDIATRHSDCFSLSQYNEWYRMTQVKVLVHKKVKESTFYFTLWMMVGWDEHNYNFEIFSTFVEIHTFKACSFNFIFVLEK